MVGQKADKSVYMVSSYLKCIINFVLSRKYLLPGYFLGVLIHTLDSAQAGELGFKNDYIYVYHMLSLLGPAQKVHLELIR